MNKIHKIVEVQKPIGSEMSAFTCVSVLTKRNIRKSLISSRENEKANEINTYREEKTEKTTANTTITAAATTLIAIIMMARIVWMPFA